MCVSLLLLCVSVIVSFLWLFVYFFRARGVVCCFVLCVVCVVVLCVLGLCLLCSACLFVFLRRLFAC